MRVEVKKEETVIRKEEVGEFRAIPHKVNSSNIVLEVRIFKFRGEGLGADCKEERGERITLAKTARGRESRGGFTVNKNRVLDRRDTFSNEIDPMVRELAFNKTVFQEFPADTVEGFTHVDFESDQGSLFLF